MLPRLESQNYPHHLVNLSYSGRLRETEELHTPAKELHLIFDGLEQSERKSLTIFFHGGLVKEKDGLKLAKFFYPKIADDFQSYPVFFVWEAGILETIRSEVNDIVESVPLFNRILEKVKKHVKKKIRRHWSGVEAGDSSDDRWDTITLGPEDVIAMEEWTADELDALEQDLAEDNEMLEPIIRKAQQVRSEGGEEAGWATGPELGYFSEDVLDQLAAVDEDGGEEWVTSKWYFVIKAAIKIGERIIRGTHHGFPATVIEEVLRLFHGDKIGTKLWNEMKENAEEAYHDNPDSPLNDDFHGGTLFLDLLRKYIADHGKVDVNLIGHSAGCIHICHFLERASKVLEDDFRLKSVIFLAPGCNFAAFRRVEAHRDRIDTFRIFTMSEEYEKHGNMIPLLYPYTLLYFVSALVEGKNPDSPIVGLARHLKGKKYAADQDVKIAHDYLKSLESLGRTPVVYSLTKENAPIGEKSRFTEHGGDHGPYKDTFTVKSMAHIICP